MKEEIDLLTRFGNRVLDVVLAKYPARTGLGLILGFFLSFVIDLFKPSLTKIEFMDFAGASWKGWIALGILLMHIPTIFALFKNNPIGDDEVDKTLALIEQSGFTKEEKKLAYRNLIVKVSNNISLSKSVQKTFGQIDSAVSEARTVNPTNKDLE